MKPSFDPLQESHFPLLLKWLEAPHVKAWWDRDVQWTPELIAEKYKDCAKGIRDGKPLYGFIMCVNGQKIGYIQYYNAYDFLSNVPLKGLPKNLGAIDLYIGEPDYIGKGPAPQLIVSFLEKLILEEFDAIFVDPDTTNTAAIRAYEKAGFKALKVMGETIGMIRLTK